MCYGSFHGSGVQAWGLRPALLEAAVRLPSAAFPFSAGVLFELTAVGIIQSLL